MQLTSGSIKSMGKMRGFKYLFIWTGVAAGWISINGPGLFSYSLPIYAFVLIPLLELLLRADPQNLAEAEQELVKADRWYDIQLYLIVPVQVGLVATLCWRLTDDSLTTAEIVGKIWSTGIGCGVMGINVAHELGHRSTWYEQLMAKVLLLTSLYMHFYIEHNRGHHKNVSTPADPASARRGENLYFFAIRSVWGSYWSAWELEHKRLRKLGKSPFSLRNEMLVYQLIQGAMLALIGIFMGWFVLLGFVLAATSGFLLLEAVNYIEHYGLQRKCSPSGVYEAVSHKHSWNSDHLIGRLLLFELSRHSDHHYRAARKYQTLRHMDGSPQMPTGYPGMLVLATVPPLWFAILHRQIARFEAGDPVASGLQVR
jgi:alkane 1-monooxygenase